MRLLDLEVADLLALQRKISRKYGTYNLCQIYDL